MTAAGPPFALGMTCGLALGMAMAAALVRGEALHDLLPHHRTLAYTALYFLALALLFARAAS